MQWTGEPVTYDGRHILAAVKQAARSGSEQTRIYAWQSVVGLLAACREVVAIESDFTHGSH